MKAIEKYLQKNKFSVTGENLRDEHSLKKD